MVRKSDYRWSKKNVTVHLASRVEACVECGRIIQGASAVRLACIIVVWSERFEDVLDVEPFRYVDTLRTVVIRYSTIQATADKDVVHINVYPAPCDLQYSTPHCQDFAIDVAQSSVDTPAESTCR